MKTEYNHAANDFSTQRQQQKGHARGLGCDRDGMVTVTIWYAM